MKKKLFLAVAMIAFVGNAYASNEIVRKKIDENCISEKAELTKDCSFLILDRNGKHIGTITVINVPLHISCYDKEVKNKALKLLNKAELTMDKSLKK